MGGGHVLEIRCENGF